ncbi:MAG TPA: ATP-binding protein [Dokdonella sp.]|uniref:ATP-binding response regulator n=1 Tax=Dokdonella sp. TaxID=2291710 RepID=UPI0025C156A3|nr:ATP-binding protein [Dokdonella sp.]MBX3690886.1 response regulator [Dokdonella sp.]HNR91402.1 ATP-binding protein [Dokdonella sp.]
MSGAPASSTVGVDLELARLLIERANPLTLDFDRDWNLRDIAGDAARFGFDGGSADAALRGLQELFLGMPLDEGVDLSFVQLPNGRNAHVHLLAGDGGFRVILLDAQDEHDRQRSQQQLGNEAAIASAQKTKAIHQLRHIREQLEQQRTRLEEANALKTALIATLSHDFRSPLTSIFGYLHLLEGNAGLDESARQHVRAVRRNASYLFALAENLLEYGRRESGGRVLNPAIVDLTALRDDLVAMFRPLAADKNLGFAMAVHVEDVRKPVLDEMRLRQILVNLLSNAVRYTLEGEVSASLTWRDGALTVEVRDTGIGIPEEYHERVFVAFNGGGQGGSKGAGLGLSIVKRLVAQLHGSLVLDSAPGRGTTFTVVLPALGQAEPDRPPTVGETGATAWLHGCKALVVDDDPDIAQLVALLLDDLGFHVRTTGDAASAVDLALADPPDVLVVDVELPGMSGNTVVYRLRAQGYKGRIVTLSATPTEEARATALAAGSDHYLTKPIHIERFVRTMLRITGVG